MSLSRLPRNIEVRGQISKVKNEREDIYDTTEIQG